MSKKNLSCVSSSSSPKTDESSEEKQTEKILEEEMQMLAKVGGKAPDFQAMAYQNGDFSEVKLSDFTNKWTILCFYPGDFTFV